MPQIERLRQLPFLADASRMALSFLADACTTAEYEPGQPIYPAGKPSERIYLIEQGQVQLRWPYAGEARAPGTNELWLGNGMALGFTGGADRAQSLAGEPLLDHDATAMAPTQLVIFERSTLEAITGFSPDRVGQRCRRTALDTVHRLTVFQQLTPAQRNKLFGYMSHYRIADHGHVLLRQGEQADSMWVLLPHSQATVVALNQAGQEIARTRVQGPTYFSEAALRVQRYLDSTVAAEANSEWLRLHRDDFQVFVHETEHGLADNLVMTVDVDELLGPEQERRRYAWLQEGEQLVLFRRRHWIALVDKIIVPVVVSFVIFGLWLVLDTAFELAAVWQAWLVGILAAATGGVWIWGVVDYLNDYLLITNNRVVRQEKIAFFSELRQSAALRQVQSVDVTTSFVGNVLGYGTLTVQTAGATGAIEFNRAATPDFVRDTLFAERNKAQMQYRASSKAVIQNVLEERFGLTVQMPPRVRSEVNAAALADSEEPGWLRALRYLHTDRYLEWAESDHIVWRKHWFVLLAKIMVPALLTAGALVLVGLSVGALLALPAFIGLPGGLFGGGMLIAALLVAIVGVGWCAWVFVDWHNDSYRIEGDQIIDVEKKPLFFAESRRTARLDDIENVELRIASPLHYLFNFGNVVLQTAAADGDLTFDFVPNPRAVTEEIRRRIEDFYRKQELDRARQRAAELPDWFETYSQLRVDRSA